ncbi:MAG: flagellar FlaF family protein [Alphaproteobacteria bacterium]|nr:flagellar FlaF family protein [Alphaproteobacteria bacterium]
MSHNNNNPYAKASGAYDSNAQTNAGNQRELEARVLYKSNKKMQTLLNDWDNRPKGLLEETLSYNRQIWVLFYDTAIENKDGGRPNDLRSNIINLANFIFKREMEILADPKKEKLDILMSINNEIAAGLMTNPTSEKAHPPQRQQNIEKQSPSTDIKS